MMRGETSKLALFCFARSDVRHYLTKELFAYERTSPILGRGRQQPFCILKRAFAISLGLDSATADCWLWFYGARVRQAVQGARKLRRHPACYRRARASSHGMAYHSDRTHRRPGSLARSFPPPCWSADGGASLRSDLHRPSTLWV